MLYLDLDHLKRINDTLGHAIGDKLLKSVADQLRSCVREINLVARLCGGEFAIIRPSIERPADAADATLKRLHELGVQFSIDDFGTGYSSLGYLLSFPFSKIKIDRSFIADLTDKKESRAIVRAITDLARSLGIRVIAEGVERTLQLEQLRRPGCTEIQGYLISPPRPAFVLPRFFPPLSDGAEGKASQVG